MKLELYTSDRKEAWDQFVLEQSINGSFLQTMQFLNYHPKERFQDSSLLFVEKGNIHAVIPACRVNYKGRDTFYSHRGSTFGGPVISSKFYSSEKLSNLFDELEDFLKLQSFEQIILKPTSNLFSKKTDNLLQYICFYRNYKTSLELSTFIDYDSYKTPIEANFQPRKRSVIRSSRDNFSFKQLETDLSCEEFYSLLCENLSKFKTTPVHTLEELLDFKNNRIKDRVEFWGLYYEEVLVAGSMVFRFSEAQAVHTQYLASSSFYAEHNPMDLLYYNLIKNYENENVRFLSWGIATEDEGRILNSGLISYKEKFGSSYSVNHSFCKILS